MTRRELALELANKKRLTQVEAYKIVKFIFSSIALRVSKGEKVMITGFGTFSLKNRKQRKGRNPATGEIITIPAHKSLGFTAGKGSKRLMSK